METARVLSRDEDTRGSEYIARHVDLDYQVLFNQFGEEMGYDALDLLLAWSM
jgi:hypothetical protein